MSRGPAPSVRAAEASDAGALAELLGQLGYPCTPSEVRDRLTALAAPEADAVFVALLAGVPAGLASLHLIPLLQEARPIARITAFVVAEAARRRGVGRLLVAACEARARAWNAARLELTSGDHRREAHAFYLALGFTRAAQRFVMPLEVTGLRSSGPSSG